ncbi:MAG: peptidase M50 [Gammaproteobacteria bacterium]|nr:peptidase M50 [Gammaproteobacteria bacterium]
MQSSEFDKLWESLGSVRFKVRDGVHYHCHQYRGSVWYILEDRLSGRQYRLSESLYELMMKFNGRETLADLWSGQAEDGSDRGELLRVMTQLQAAELLIADHPVAPSAQINRWNRQQKQRSRGRWMRPLAPRFPLLDPDRFLRRALPLVSPLFSLPFLLLWLLLMAGGALAAGMHLEPLYDYGASRFSDPRNLLLLWLVYPLVKILHELGHGFAIKRWGGEVHEMGIMLLVFVPIPYVEASVAGVFPERRRRVVVGAAGIMVEAAIAAVAVIAWVNLGPGLLKDLCYDLFVVAGVSTVLFNGNPLLRFDGYYVMTDAIGIPNLATRSNRYYGYLFKRYLFGVRDAMSPVTAAGERFWFLLYGLAAMVYRLFISLTIAFYLAGTYLLLGAVLAVWALTVQFLLPIAKGLGFIVLSPVLQGRRVRAVTVTLALLLVIPGIISFLKMPQGTWAEGVVRPVDGGIVRAEVDGFVQELMHRHGDLVEIREPLLRLEDRQLDARIAVLKGKLQEIQARLDSEALGDRVQVEIYRERRAKLQRELAQAEADYEKLTLLSPSQGRLELPRSQDLPGRYVKKGETLGYVFNESAVTVRVVIPQPSIDRMLSQARRITLHLPGSGGRVFQAHSLEAVPSATSDLPSSALGSQGGGAIAVDSRDERGLRAIQKVFQFDITLDYEEALGFVGRRVYVRFEHEGATLAPRLYQQFRRLLLSRLET